jgi:hypothetical protein
MPHHVEAEVPILRGCDLGPTGQQRAPLTMAQALHALKRVNDGTQRSQHIADLVAYSRC